jgi:hypothetical protein
MGIILKFLTSKSLLTMVASLAIFTAAQSFIMHQADKLTPTPAAPQPVVLGTDPQSEPFDGQDLTPAPHVPAPAHGAGSSPEEHLLAAATAPDSSTPTIEETPSTVPGPAVAPAAESLEELVTSFIRNYEALKDAHARKDKHHKADYLKERERLSIEISRLVPVQSQAPEATVSQENEYLNARAQENGEAIEDLRFCLQAIEQQKTAALKPSSN